MGSKLDITGKTFGNLLALRNTGEKKQKTYIWEFKCLLCGNIVRYKVSDVTYGACTSCGCVKIANLRKHTQKEKLGIFNDTSASRLLGNKLPKNNTTGHVGVYLQTRRNGSQAYIAYIYFQKRRYSLGSYHSKADAIKARERAENELFGNFLQWYAENYPDDWRRLNKSDG